MDAAETDVATNERRVVLSTTEYYCNAVGTVRSPSVRQVAADKGLVPASEPGRETIRSIVV
jgi:hypothetical protein